VTRVGQQLANETFDGIRVTGVKVLPHGHSAGLMAIGTACRELRDGTAAFLLAGGVDSYIDADTLEWLDDCERLHIPTNAWGFLPGEAAGFCLLCSVATAERHGLKVLGKIAAMATANEPNRIYTETVCIGEGLTPGRATGSRLHAAGCEDRCHALRPERRGLPCRRVGFMLARTSEGFVNPADFEAPADCWGDVGAASGPLFVVLAAMAAKKGYAKGPRTLLWTSSESGERSAVLFEADPMPFGRH
jgi:3-oxoacyl-[acyl-carrier-protein] synthase-1